MASFKGSAADLDRGRMLEKQRATQKAQFEEKSRALTASGRGLRDLDAQFADHTATRTEEVRFKSATVGLVTADDFAKKRELMQKAADEAEAQREIAKSKVRKQMASERRAKLAALSFSHDLEDDEEEEEEFVPTPARKRFKTGEKAAADSNTASLPKGKLIKKDPAAVTHFLPDRDREEEERKLRDSLTREFMAKQEDLKKQLIEITYSYWDGSGHRRSIRLTKGSTIDQFLEQCRRDLSEEFQELRNISSEHMMYIKEDLIIPSHYSFYDLIVTKARGKSGPLFHFDVHDDVRLLADATIEKDESHAGKIITRGWYDRNKHIFPASRWEVYDPSVARTEKYTIHGGEVR